MIGCPFHVAGAGLLLRCEEAFSGISRRLSWISSMIVRFYIMKSKHSGLHYASEIFRVILEDWVT